MPIKVWASVQRLLVRYRTKLLSVGSDEVRRQSVAKRYCQEYLTGFVGDLEGGAERRSARQDGVGQKLACGQDSLVPCGRQVDGFGAVRVFDDTVRNLLMQIESAQANGPMRRRYSASGVPYMPSAKSIRASRSLIVMWPRRALMNP
jgi:hypothetical protein